MLNVVRMFIQRTSKRIKEKARSTLKRTTENRRENDV